MPIVFCYYLYYLEALNKIETVIKSQNVACESLIFKLITSKTLINSQVTG